MREQNQMLVAIRSGVLVESDELVELTRGKDRVAVEVLDRCPAYEEFFDRGVRGSNADRSVTRLCSHASRC